MTAQAPYSSGNVLLKETPFPRWIAMEILWKRYVVSRGSSVTRVVRLPISWMISDACVFQTPDVSMAIGTKMCVWLRSAYLMHFCVAAWSAAAPANVDVWSIWESAKVSGIVTSQASGFPLAQGICVTPSGLLPSVVTNPRGSFEAGTCARLMARQMMSLICACLVCSRND